MNRLRKGVLFKFIATLIALNLASAGDGGTLVSLTGAGSPAAEAQSASVIINKLTPESAAPGTYVTIQGAGFSSNPSDNTVTFGALQSGSFAVISSNQLRTQVPYGLTAGFADVSVCVNGNDSNSLNFNVLAEVFDQIFIDKTQDLLPAGINIDDITDSSVLKLADIDKQKGLDLFIADSVDNKVYLLVNDGSGKFDDASNKLPELSPAYAITDAVFGDVNGDSYPDIVLTYSEGQSVRLLVNNKSGGFTDVPSNLPDVSGQATSLDLGDADGDGLLDIIIARSNAKDLLFINKGSGIFEEAEQFDLSGELYATSDILFTDLDGDGHPDIIAASYDSSSIHTYINDGNGSFADETGSRFLDNDEYTKALALGDINGDYPYLSPDLVAGNYEYDSVFLNNGSGTFYDVTGEPGSIPAYYSATNDVELGDVDGDGNLDLILLGEENLSLLLNDGMGYFLQDISLSLPDYESEPAPIGGRTVELADIDADGDLDIIIGGSSFRILENGTSQAPVIECWTPAYLKFSLFPGQIMAFGVRASNPIPEEDLEFKWIFNRKEIPPVTGYSSSMLLVIPKIGDNELTIIVKNSAGEASKTWEFTAGTIINELPRITARKPDVDSKIIDLAEGALLRFSITATDDDDDDSLLTYQWKLGLVGTMLEVLAGEDESELNAGGHVARLLPGLNYTLRATVIDPHGAWKSNDWTLIITRNYAPEAHNDSAVTTNDTPVDIDVLKNDTDRNAEDTLAVASVTQPVNGTAEIINNGAMVKYTPNSEFAGEDAFTYIATDGKLDSNSATVTVTVEDNDVTQLLDDLTWKTFQYFIDEANPLNGLVRDRVRVDGASAPSDNISSIAATGFGLSALCIGAEKGWVDANEASSRALTTINTFIDIQNNQAADPAKYGNFGFFYHFLDMNMGERINDSEVSSIDTAILVAGALTAGEYFGGEVQTKANTLYSNVEWAEFLDTSNNLFYMAWSPESGFSENHWDYYSESLMLYLLAIGSPTHPVDGSVFYSFRRVLGKYGDDGLPLVQSWFGSLFTYQYSHAWFDFRNLRDAQNVYWFQNSIDATIANRQFCMDNAVAYGYGENFWGLNASDGPGGIYIEYGAPPLGAGIPISDGTVASAGSAGSIAMTPAIVIPNLLNIYNSYEQDVWERYGFIDSLNLKPDQAPWYADYYIGIDVGISLLMTENYRSAFVWNRFMQNQEVQNAMTSAGFTSSTAYTYLDEAPYSDFTSVLLTDEKQQQEIIYNIGALQSGEYLLALQPFGMDNKGVSFVDVAVSVNGVDRGTIRFTDPEASGTRNVPNVYKVIDSTALYEGENSIVLTKQEGGEAWLSLKKIEIKAPRAPENTWTIGEQDDSYADFGDEWLIDDTYYAGDSVDTFEKALNINNEAFTDILFYINDLTRDRELVLNSLESDGDVSVGIEANGNVIEGGTLIGASESVDITVPTTGLRAGWNWLRLMHVNQPGSGKWITWDSVELDFKPFVFGPPTGLAGAAFGADKINLRWSANLFTGTDGYNLYRSQTQGGPYTTEVNTGLLMTTSFQDTGLDDRTTYYYVVTSVDIGGTLGESGYSGEIEVTTGDYELDYRDGKEPNAFGGTSSGNFAYTETTRYDWTAGPVREITLSPGEEGWIGLNGVDLSPAARLSIWIKSDAGDEKIEIGLKGAGSPEATVDVTVAGGWQNLLIKLTDFAGLSLGNMEKLYVRSDEATSTVTLYLDDIVLVREAASAHTLEVTPKYVSDNSRSTGISFDNLPDFDYAPAEQYIEVKYGGVGGAIDWKIWIYTKNENGDQEYLEDQFNGLMSSDGRHRIPLLWRVYPDVQEDGVPCRVDSDVYYDPPDPETGKLSWNYVKDKNDADWASANQPNEEYSVICFGRYNEWAHIAGVPPGLGDRDPSNSTFRVYLGGIFEVASPGEYSTAICFDLTHE